MALVQNNPLVKLIFFAGEGSKIGPQRWKALRETADLATDELDDLVKYLNGLESASARAARASSVAKGGGITAAGASAANGAKRCF